MLGFRIKGFCHICNKSLRFKVYQADTHIFCRKHLIFYQQNEWIHLKSFFFHAEDESAAHLEDLRIKLYQEKRFPIIQKMGYRTVDDKIITETRLFCLRKHQEKLLEILQKKGPSEDGPLS